MKCDRIKTRRQKKNTVLIRAMMIMLACTRCFYGFDHDRQVHGDGDGGGMASTIEARAEYMRGGIKSLPLHTVRVERAVSG